MTDYLKLVRPDYKSFYDEGFQWSLKGTVEISDAAPLGSSQVGFLADRV